MDNLKKPKNRFDKNLHIIQEFKDGASNVQKEIDDNS